MWMKLLMQKGETDPNEKAMDNKEKEKDQYRDVDREDATLDENAEKFKDDDSRIFFDFKISEYLIVSPVNLYVLLPPCQVYFLFIIF